MAYEGECNRCGRCCQSVELDREGKLQLFSCVYLIKLAPPGTPEATLCDVHQIKFCGMPIQMISADGLTRRTSFCVSDFPRAEHGIPPECSYRWTGDDPQPLYQITGGAKL